MEKIIYPNKLREGDTIKVIAPSRSLSIISNEVIAQATKTLKKLGLNIEFSENCLEKDDFNSSSVESRVKDLNEAFANLNIKGILTAIGGYNSNDLLQYIDYELISQNPKILCGYSDITSISNAITQKTGMVTYSGPHFSTFGMEKGLEYTIQNFKNILFDNKEVEIVASKEWSDEAWYIDQKNRNFEKNNGYKTLNEGSATGKVVGGHMRCLACLQGTEFFPDLDNSILLLEDTENVNSELFNRMLQSLIHLPNFRGVKGILVGRFQKNSKISDELLLKIIKSKPELKNIPIISGLDFGHTTPMLTLPIGSLIKIVASQNTCQIKILAN